MGKSEDQPTESTKQDQLSIQNNSDTTHLANDLAKFIKEKRLYQNIQGKEYVNVEGWQYAGSRLGILAIPESCTIIQSDEEIKYEARVKLLELRSGNIVGGGYAICSNKEQGKKYYQEFAIASMAQTRAIGKAYRNTLAWIIRAAGYSPTPVEEMDESIAEENSVQLVISELLLSKGRDEGMKILAKYPQHHNDPLLVRAVEILKSFYASEDLKSKAHQKSESEKVAAKKQETEPEQPEEEYNTEGGRENVAISAQAKDVIIKLLNSPAITRSEKTKMLLGINQLSELRGNKAITKLRATIKERTESGQVREGQMERYDGATKAQIDQIQKLIKSHVIYDTERDSISANLPTMLKDEASLKIDWLHQVIKERKAAEAEKAKQDKA